MVVLALELSALAGDEGPHVWLRHYDAIAVNPLGVQTDVAAEVRAPVLRLGGVAFNDTFVGAGARVTLSPVNVDTAARVSLQLIDLLPITLEVVRTVYWESPWGMVPVDSVEDTFREARRPLYEADRDFAATGWSLIASPTLQARAGPVVAFTNWILTFQRLRPVNGPEPWVFEPVRGMANAYDERITEHTSAILLEPLDGKDRPLLRVGPVLRGRFAAETPDVMLSAGAVTQLRPGRSEYDPTFLLIAAPYLRDPEFQGILPFVAFVATFQGAVEL